MKNDADNAPDATTANTEDWTPHGNFKIKLRPDKFRIFPKGSDGQVRPIWIRRVYIDMERETLTGEVATLTFKFYKHQRNLYWNDGRQKGSCSRHHIEAELARLLFGKDREQARVLMTMTEALL